MNRIQKQASELMPKSKEALRILQARAQELAKYEESASESNGIAYVQFRLGQNESYGIAYQYVHEILHNITLAKPPGVPDFIAGVINWRGSLITVVDLLKFFHPDPTEHKNEFIIVCNINDSTLGLLVNRVEGSAVYQSSQLSIPLSSANVTNPEYILGLDQSVTAILNVDVLVAGISQKIIYKV